MDCPSRGPKTSLRVLAALLVTIGCVFIPLQSSRAQHSQNPPGRVGRVALIDGTVSYHTADQNYWQAARRNNPITTGQAFWTEPNAHAALDVDNSRIYLSSSTELDVATLDDQTTAFSLLQGAIFAVLRTSPQSGPYEVQLARAGVALTGAGRFEIIAGDTEHESQVIVFDGTARVTGNGIDLEARSGEMIVLVGEETVRGEVRPAASPDAFMAWVERQEVDHEWKAPAMASAMAGAAELGAYGRWVRSEGYGDVWFPDVAGDWAPYRNGYWGWVEPWGWTWVAEEAWGFAPFHYGRWRVIDDRWGWIPFDATIAENLTPIYAPAVVTFFATQDACAWVPLAPGEVYVPPYPASQSYFQQINAPYVANIMRFTSVTTEKININQYLNRAAAAAVPRSVMSSSQPVRSAGRPSRVTDMRPVLGNPPVRPTPRTAGLSPSVARRFGITQGPAQQFRAPGPPIRETHAAPNARLTPPRALAPAAQSAISPQHRVGSGLT